MNATLYGKFLLGGLALAALVSLSLWLSAGTPHSLEARVPGMDKADLVALPQRSLSGPDGEVIPGPGEPMAVEGLWPNFRGPDLDNIYDESFRPIPPGQGFEQLWAIDVGEGFAGAAIRDGRVYVLDYDRENRKDALRCLSLEDGREIWRYEYPVIVKRNHGMSRTTPYVTDSLAVSLGPKGHVTCVDAITGEKRWSLDLVYAYDAEIPPWYAGQNPLVDEGRLILGTGGKALVVALDLETGEVIWESPNPNEWKMTHSSITPMMLNGERTYIYCASGGVAAVSAEDGRILWETPEWTIKMANVPSPLVVDDKRVFFCGGYGAGAMMLSLNDNDGAIEPVVDYRLDPDVFGSTQHTPILYQNHIFGVRPDGELICLDLDGNVVWASGPNYRFGLGPYLIAGSTIYVMDDDGLLTRAEAGTNEFRLIDQTQVLEGHESWAPISMASGRMIVRDLTRMACLKSAL